MEKDPLHAARSRLGNAVRFGDKEAAREARRDLHAATLARHIDKALNAEPPLSDDQRDMLAVSIAPWLVPTGGSH